MDDVMADYWGLGLVVEKVEIMAVLMDDPLGKFWVA